MLGFSSGGEVALAEQAHFYLITVQPPLAQFLNPAQIAAGGHSRTRNRPGPMSLMEYEQLLESLPVEESSQMRIELENTEIEWLLTNYDRL